MFGLFQVISAFVARRTHATRSSLFLIPLLIVVFGAERSAGLSTSSRSQVWIRQVGVKATLDRAFDLDLYSNYVVVSDEEAGLSLYRYVLNFPSVSLTYSGNYNTPYAALSTDISGNVCYVADADALQIISIASPSSPTLVGSIPIWAHDVEKSGSYAYVVAPADGGWAGSLNIVDVSIPSSPVVVGTLNSLGQLPYGIEVIGSYAYIADIQGLKIINISNPSSPFQVGRYDTPGDAKDVKVYGDLAFVADAFNSGLQVIDISNPSTPTFVGSYIPTEGYVYDVVVDGSFAYLAAGPQGLIVVDITDPANITLAGSYVTPGGAMALSLMNAGSTTKLVFLAEFSPGTIRVLEVTTTPPNQAPVAFIDEISPNPAIAGSEVTFTGYGADDDGVISGYEWYSSRDGILSNEAMFSTSGLTVGDHTISLKVQDDDGAWSPVVSTQLDIMPKALVIKDKAGNPISNKASFYVYKVDKNDKPNYTEQIVLTNGNPLPFTTDSEGRIFLPAGSFISGEWIKVERQVHTQPAVKHVLIENTMFDVYLDNAKFNTSSGDMSYLPYDDQSPQQDVIMDHSTFVYNLVISIEWDAEIPYLTMLQSGVRGMANYLYDIFDGQVRLGRIHIFDDKSEWGNADIQIHATNDLTPHVSANGGIWRSAGSLGCPILYPREHFRTIEETIEHLPEDPSSLKNYQALTHELGHYAFSFWDEYRFVTCLRPIVPLPACKCSGVECYGLMESPWCSEISNADKYSSILCQNTFQYVFTGFQSCWQFFESSNERSYDGILVPILSPSERGLPPGSYFSGPNWNTEVHAALNYDVGALVLFPVSPSAPNAETKNSVTRNQISGLPWGHTTVWTEQSSGNVIQQGQSDSKGKIRIMGFKPGDKAYSTRAYTYVDLDGTAKSFWLSGSSLVIPRASSDTLELLLRNVQGDFPAVFQFDLSLASDQLHIYCTKQFTATPTITLQNDSSGTHDYSSVWVNGEYNVHVPDDLGLRGFFKFTAMDDSSSEFFALVQYSIAVREDSSTVVFSPSGVGSLVVDNLDLQLLDKIMVLESQYPVPRTGLHPSSCKVGCTFNISATPVNGIYGQNNALQIRYSDSVVSNLGIEEASLRIYHWSEADKTWTLVGGGVDTTANLVSAGVWALGTYGLFTTISFLCGDANHSGIVSISDVVYLIAYIFTGGPAPSPLLAGDVNCSGAISISDAVYLINYIFGGGAAPCAACP